MSSESLNCIFCTETFQSREELQVHFRQHGDPALHASLKTKCQDKKRSGGAQGGGGASAGGPERVRCDACSETFPTVARAITHKHKFHPDYHIKHFCCWCGKLFPIKHLSDKHKAVHTPSPQPAEVFRCDECLFDFYTVTAVTYHNRSYHRADAPEPHFVGSRKFRLVNKELVQTFFCFLCGEEFINSFNLQKHVAGQHTSEEWCEPGADVLRCPRCDAVFHSQHAYVAHLSHHTAADVYVDTPEPMPELKEYTLDTLPPIIETMETPITSVDIDDLLQLGADMSSLHEESEPASSSDTNTEKKEKAPRKAITLNQFLSMNKDVFGDVFSLQGVEEVPSQVVANQLRPKRPRPQPVMRPGTKIVAQNLQKLKDQGVMVQVKNPTRKPMIPGSRVSIANGIGKPIKVAPSAFVQGQALRPGTTRPALMKVARPPGLRPPGPIRTPGPVRMAGPARSPGPAQSPGPARSPGPAQSSGPARSPGPAQSPGSAQSPGPARSPGPVRTPVPVRTPGPVRPVGKPLKMIPGAVRSPQPPKKQSGEPTPGPFSCFKKPKESLIPISDVPGISEMLQLEPAVSIPPTKLNVTPALSSKSNTNPTPFTNKSNPAAVSTKSNVNSATLNIKSNSNSGMIMSKPNGNQSSILSKSNTTAAPKPSALAKPSAAENNSIISKNKTDEALEKLRKQGLLVKKPKLESDSARDSPPSSDAPCLTVKGGG